MRDIDRGREKVSYRDREREREGERIMEVSHFQHLPLAMPLMLGTVTPRKKIFTISLVILPLA